jgi:hypothetical protein
MRWQWATINQKARDKRSNEFLAVKKSWWSKAKPVGEDVKSLKGTSEATERRTSKTRIWSLNEESEEVRRAPPYAIEHHCENPRM